MLVKIRNRCGKVERFIESAEYIIVRVAIITCALAFIWIVLPGIYHILTH